MLTIWTYDWAPGGENGPRGVVRDLRLRWACEEAALDYDVKSTPFDDRRPQCETGCAKPNPERAA
jgi:glutathione S-transferase